eukprot:100290-Karenia_brevis.AAC.1
MFRLNAELANWKTALKTRKNQISNPKTQSLLDQTVNLNLPPCDSSHRGEFSRNMWRPQWNTTE